MLNNMFVALILVGSLNLKAETKSLNHSVAKTQNASVKTVDTTSACPFGNSGSCTVTSQASCGALTGNSVRVEKSGHATGVR